MSSETAALLLLGTITALVFLALQAMFELTRIHKARLLDLGCIRFSSCLSSTDIHPQDITAIVRRLGTEKKEALNAPPAWTFADHLRAPPRGDRDWSLQGFRVEHSRGLLNIWAYELTICDVTIISHATGLASMAAWVAELSPGAGVYTERELIEPPSGLSG